MPHVGAPADGRRAIDPGATVGDLVAPAVRGVPLDPARRSGLLAAVIAALVTPAWTAVDRLVSPREASLFLIGRLVCDVPLVLLAVALAVLPLGRRRPELLTFAVLAVVQLEAAWIVSRAPATPAYVLGLALPLVGSGCLLAVRPRWTAALILTTWIALAVAVLAAARPVAGADLVSVLGCVGATSLIAMLAHLHRQATTVSERTSRLRLEQEQERSRVLLAQLERFGHQDPLTGLANRRRWDAELVSVCAGVRARGGAVSLLLLDLDRFTRINDVHGHPRGDEVLRRVAATLSARLGAGDLVARLGGDEFAVLLPGTGEERAVAVAEAMRRAAAGLRLEGFDPGEVSVSVGVATATGAEAYPLELMSRADQQLYLAKITRNAVGARTGAR